MKNSKHIILGDVHIGKGLNIGKPANGNKLNSRVQDQLDLLYWTLNKGIENNVSSIILTGDVYEDPKPHPALINYFMEWVKNCEYNNIDVHIIVGNHDIVRSGSYTVSALDIIPAVNLPKANTYKYVYTINYPGVSFTLIPYRDRRMYSSENYEESIKKLENEFKDEPYRIPETNHKVAVGHIAIENSIYIGDEIDDSVNELFCTKDMFSEYDYIWMGHIHKPQLLNKNPRLAHIGSMDRSSFSKEETDHNKHIVLFDTSKEVPFIEIPLPTRNLIKAEIEVPSSKDTTDYVVNSLFSLSKNNNFDGAIARLEVRLLGQDLLNCDRSKVEKFLYEKLNIHYLCSFLESRNVSVLTIDDSDKFSSTMDTDTAILAYSENLDIEEEDKEEFKRIALECEKDYKELIS